MSNEADSRVAAVTVGRVSRVLTATKVGFSVFRCGKWLGFELSAGVAAIAERLPLGAATGAPEILPWLELQDRVNKRIHERFAAAGIEMAFPTQTIYNIKSE